MSTRTTPSHSRCPVCGKPPVAAFVPFCSQGCRDRDLLQWLGEGYRVPGRPLDEDSEGDEVENRAEKPGAGLDSERDPPL